MAPHAPHSLSESPNGAVIRHDWTVAEVVALHDLPLFELLDRARAVHVAWHTESEVQLCTLLSVKTGGCPEDCAYCPQSSHYETEVGRREDARRRRRPRRGRPRARARAHPLLHGRRLARGEGRPAFDRVLDMVRGVKALGLEACCTLGMLTEDQARRLKDAGLDAYNHNLDTSRQNYPSIITTRAYDERLATLRNVRRAGITVCSGGILGMGESVDDRCAMLVELAQLDPQPESVPINALVRVAGTPLAALPPVDPIEFVRIIATARIVFPRAMVRLSAGRTDLTREAQLLAMYAGANSIFYGDQLLTTPNPGPDADEALLRDAGLSPMAPAQ